MGGADREMPRVMSYNIRYGGVGKQAELAEVIRRVAPDVLPASR